MQNVCRFAGFVSYWMSMLVLFANVKGNGSLMHLMWRLWSELSALKSIMIVCDINGVNNFAALLKLALMRWLWVTLLTWVQRSVSLGLLSRNPLEQRKDIQKYTLNWFGNTLWGSQKIHCCWFSCFVFLHYHVCCQSDIIYTFGHTFCLKGYCNFHPNLYGV